MKRLDGKVAAITGGIPGSRGLSGVIPTPDQLLTSIDNKSLDLRFQNFSDGRWCPIDTARVVALQDPITEDSIGGLPTSDREAVEQSVMVAKMAFINSWKFQDQATKLNHLSKLIAAIEARHEDFAQMISWEIGAPIEFSRRHQVDAALAHLRATLVSARSVSFDDRVSVKMSDHRVRYEPIGVAVLITPWNWPLNQVVLKVGAALVAGCTMVLKPSEFTSGTAMLFAQCMDEIGLPDGVFNLLLGDAETGRLLCQNQDVDVISFTGSTRAGEEIAAAAAVGMRQVRLELGGKSPNLIFADADLELAVQQGVAHCFRNSGQSCNAASRMLVDASVYDQVVDLVSKQTNLYAQGDDSPNALGPVINARQFERIQTLIQSGIDQGARLVAGGPGRPSLNETGYFVKPTVFADVSCDMTIAQQEIFGPVLCISSFEGEAAAIELANSTPYGLAAYIQTGSLDRADRVACQLDAGMIQVNGTSRAPGAPFGGVKASGHGREAGLWGIRSFQAVKSISGASICD